ncbi:MAG TPA: DEAD/DEAH box helicase, partial [Spirochaetota bacterium]|nr:DEAD/DEAH box helicase [Spirochaetota bacterium]
DNKFGILENEKSVYDILKSKIENSLNSNESISLYIVTNFTFFESFRRLSNLFLLLFEKNLLDEFKLIFVSKNRLNVKEIYKEFKKDAISLDNESYKILEKLYIKRKFECKIFIEKGVDTNIFITKSGLIYETYIGSASFSSITQTENIEFIASIDKSEKRNVYLDLFDYFVKNSSIKLYDKTLIDIIKKSANIDTLFLNHKDFISTTVKVMEKEFLVKNLGADLSLFSEIQYMSYYCCLDILKNYGLGFLYNTAGLGKTEISSLVAKYYKDNDKNILVIHGPNDLKKWQDTIKKYNLKEKDLGYLSRSELYKKDFEISNFNNFDLIIITECEIYRNFEIDNYFNHNFRQIIKQNKNSDFLLISDFFTISSLLDFSKIIKLFDKVSSHPKFVTNKIIKTIDILEESIKNDFLNEDTLEQLFFIINTLSVNIKSTDFNTYFTNTPIVNQEKLTITQVKYAYTHEIYVKIYDKLSNFLHDLNLEYIKLWNKTIQNVDLNYYRFRIYKKLESSIYTFRVCLKNILDKNIITKKILTEGVITDEIIFSKSQQENIIKNFTNLDDSAKDIIMSNVNKDIKNIESAIAGMEQIKYLENHDDKITSLLKILKTENKPTLIFSESKDTVLYIERRLRDYGNFKTVLCYGNEQTFEEDYSNGNSDIDRNQILNEFNNGDKNVLISTDVFDENFIFNRAEIVINFDFSYNTSLLYQRANKLGKNIFSKKTKIYNFQPDRRIDKEASIFETLGIKSPDLFAMIGLDFVNWLCKEKNEDISNKNIQNIYYLTRDYKDLLSTKNPEDLQIKFHLSSLENNIILREYIKYFNISEDTLKLTSLKYNKPIFTTFKSSNDSYFVFFEYEGEVYSLNNIVFSEETVESELTSDDIKSIYQLVNERISVINKKLNKDTAQIPNNIPMGIIKYSKE